MKAVVVILLLALAGVQGQEQATNEDLKGLCDFMAAKRIDKPGSPAPSVKTVDGTNITAVTPGMAITACGPVANGTRTILCLIGEADERDLTLLHSSCIYGEVVNPRFVCRFNVPHSQADELQIRVVIFPGPNDEYAVYSTGIKMNKEAGSSYSSTTSGPTSTTGSTTRTTTTVKSTTPTVARVEEDPHDSQLEAMMAAKWAERRQKMAEDEDKNSEGDWQKLQEEERREREKEMQEEMEDFERRTEEERRAHEEMIRMEMLDKEEHDVVIPPKIPEESQGNPALPSEEGLENDDGVVSVEDNNIVVRASASQAGVLPTLLLFAVILVVALIL